jgi:hypothetical protein
MSQPRELNLAVGFRSECGYLRNVDVGQLSKMKAGDCEKSSVRGHCPDWRIQEAALIVYQKQLSSSSLM